MIIVKHKANPFAEFKNEVINFNKTTLNTLLSKYKQGDEFEYPTIVRVNGKPWLRKDWNNVVEDNSEIEIVAVVGAVVPVLLIVNLVILAASVAFSAYGVYKARKAMRALRAGQGQAEADPFFSVDGQSNKANLNNPIEVAYGRNRMWPSYIGRPYRTYYDDRLHGWDEKGYVKNVNLVQIFCIGQGDFDIHSVQIGDTPIENYRGLRYEIVTPGNSSTGIARIVYIQPDFKEISLAVEQSTDWFLMSPSGVASDRVEIDIEYPTNGEYLFWFEAKEVDINTGVITNSATNTVELRRPYSLWLNGTPDYTEQNSPPHRHTHLFTFGNPAKRYIARIYNTSTSQTLKVLELRSFSDPQIPLGYSDKTLLTLNYFVTNFEDEQLKDKVNVIATRKLKSINTVNGSRVEIVQPSRSIPWAFYDCLCNNVYGGGLPEEFIDIDKLGQLHELFELRGITFDNIFNQNTVVEDAAKVIASAGRCSLTYNGSKLTLITDFSQGPAEAMFSSENIIKDSFQWSSEMFDPTEPDAVEATYVETDSGKTNTVLFVPENSIANNVQKISLTGINSKFARKESAYRMRKLQLVRDTFKFKTGMEGYIPSVGAVAMLSSEMTGMGESGYVEGYTDGWLFLSRCITVGSDSVIAKISLRRDNGSVMGPFEITDCQEPNSEGRFGKVYIGVIDFDIDFWRTDKEPVHFIAWPGNLEAPTNTKIQIESLTPNEDGTVEVVATNYDKRVYEFDDFEFVEDENLPISTTGVVPKISWIKVSSVETPKTSTGMPYTRIEWNSAFGAVTYNVSVNNVGVWGGTETFVELPIEPSAETIVQVTPVSSSLTGVGKTISFTVGQTLVNTYPVIANDFTRFEKDGVVIFWDDVLEADYYEIRFYVSGYSVTSRIKTTNNSFKLTKSKFKEFFPNLVVSAASLSVEIRVRACINSAFSSESIKTFQIPKAATPTGLSVVQDPRIESNGRFTRHRTISWDSVSQLPGTLYSVYAEAYFTGSTIVLNPWVKLITTETTTFSTRASIGHVENSNMVITPIDPSYGISDHPVYGPGCMADIDNQGGNWIMDVGEMQENTLYVYDPAFPENGKWHMMIKFGTTQGDGIVWIAKATSTYLTGKRASVVYPYTSTYQTPRIKGAVVANNGWFDSSAVSKSTFDVDA